MDDRAPVGVLLVDKPAGITSHDVVARTRRELRERGHGKVRVGHAGTLDPFATGLLLVLIGRATRCQQVLMGLDKRYEVLAQLGARSDTGDRDGRIEQTGRMPAEPWPLPTGRIRQRPPAYSAVHVGGERAYARARRGEEVIVPEREVCVHEFRRLARDGDRARFAVRCSSGTYVRSLIADLGDAYCLELRRTAIGPFDVADADPEHPLALDDALGFLPGVLLDGEQARRATHGVAVPAPDEARGAGPDSWWRLRDAGGLIALAHPRDGTLLKPVVGFRG